jgi:signal transduction histidine kinase
MASISSSTLHDAHAPARSSRTSGNSALLGVAVLFGPLTLALLKAFPALDLVYQAPWGHFGIVTSAALVAVGLALLMLRVGVVRQDGRVLLLSAGFLALSTIFLVHAVATPNVLFAHTGHATAWSTPIALLVAAIMLAASTSDRLAQQAWIVHGWRWWFSAGALVWLAYAGFMLFYVPAQAASATQQKTNEQGEYSAYGADATDAHDGELTLQSRMMAIAPATLPPLYGAIVCLYGASAVVYAQRYRRSPTCPLLALTLGAMLLAQTALAAYLGPVWHLSFWLYHLLLLAAVLTVALGVLIGYGTTGSISSTVEGLFLGPTVERQRAAFQRGMTTLLLALEQGDPANLPQVRSELRQRFALADDQLDLLQHAVELVAGEREEQRRLQALVAVSRATTLNLDPDALLHDAVHSFAETTDAAICAIGLSDGETIRFDPRHCRNHVGNLPEPLTIPHLAVPEALFEDEDAFLIGPLSDTLAMFNGGSHPALMLPLRHHDRVLGVLLMQPKTVTIDEPTVAICRSIGAHLASALANARLHQELRHKHERLQRSEQAREELTQMVVHDLKNPLTSIKGYHALLQLTQLMPDQRELVQGAERSAATMIRLVNDMLDLARLEEGRIELHRGATDVAALLHACRDELRPWSEEVEKPIVIDVPAPLPHPLLDGNLLRRVLTNLLSNALKHTPCGTQITLRAEVSEAVTQITVHDTGPGIPPERMATLFERWSASAVGDQRQSNTGLGLSFCKLAVEAHGGSIEVRSAAGQGTSFTINLPLPASTA